MNAQPYIDATRHWLESVVIDLNLCPFAKRELVKERIRFAVTDATTEEALLLALHDELQILDADDSVATTLLIHPQALQDFHHYNDFLAEADGLLAHLGYEGTYQVASFHPDYQFGGTEPDDAENYTNRCPYPMLHLLREDALAEAIDSYPNTDNIPVDNIAKVTALGAEHMRALLKRCLLGSPRADDE